MNKILFTTKYLLIMTAVVFAGFFDLAGTAFAAGPCTSANIRWAGTSNRIYVSGDVECTLTEIKNLGSKSMPLNLVDAENKIWFLGANLFLQNGAKVKMYSSANGGDVNELRLKSNNSSSANSFVEIRAEYGILDINGAKVISWDEAVSGPDTEHATYKRAFIRARSKLVSGVPQESRIDIKNSDVGYLGFYGAESYGLSWKVLGGAFDTVGVYGSVENNKIHNNYFGAYTYGAQAMNFLGNEVYQNVKYGIDPHDDSDFILIDGNNVYNNGNHGIICSQRCNDIAITNNTVSYNTGNGIMIHRNVTDSLIKNNDVRYNTDSGIAVFDSHRNVISDNISKNNGSSGFRISVGSSENVIENNVFSDNAKYGLFFYKGSSVPTSGDGRPKLNTFRNNLIESNIKEGIKLSEADSNVFESNEIVDNGSYAVRMYDTDANLFERNALSGNALNYYYARFESANTIQNTDAFFAKIGDTASTLSVIDSNNNIFSITKNLATNALPDQSLVHLDRDGAGKSIVGFRALNFTVVPASDSVQITPMIWNIAGDYYKKWTAQNSVSAQIPVSYVVGSLTSETLYNVLVNGSSFGLFTSDSAGRISFTYDGPYNSTKTFEVVSN